MIISLLLWTPEAKSGMLRDRKTIRSEIQEVCRSGKASLSGNIYSPPDSYRDFFFRNRLRHNRGDKSWQCLAAPTPPWSPIYASYSAVIVKIVQCCSFGIFFVGVYRWSLFSKIAVSRIGTQKRWKYLKLSWIMTSWRSLKAEGVGRYNSYTGRSVPKESRRWGQMLVNFEVPVSI